MDDKCWIQALLEGAHDVFFSVSTSIDGLNLVRQGIVALQYNYNSEKNGLAVVM